MSEITTPWSAPGNRGPKVIVQSHMVMPGKVAHFDLPDVDVVNRGRREAGIFLLADGTITSAVPIGFPVMTTAEADWIAANALTRIYRDGAGGVDVIRICACHFGPCGHCGAGNHHKCTHRSRPEWRPTSGEGWIVGRRGNAYQQAQLLRASGPACRWICPCPVCVEKDRPTADPFARLPLPKRRPPAGQLSLF